MASAPRPRTKEEPVRLEPSPRSESEAVTEAEPPERLGPATVSKEAICERAHEKFVARGCVHGHDHEDWCAAEAELLAEAEGRQP